MVNNLLQENITNKRNGVCFLLKTWIPGETPEKEELKQQLDVAKKKLYDLQMKIKEHKIPVLVLFEGWSAAGKGSMIGKVIKNIDPRFFKVATMSAPSDPPFSYSRSTR